MKVNRTLSGEPTVNSDKLISFGLLPFVVSSFLMQYFTDIIDSYVLFFAVIFLSAVFLFAVAYKRILPSFKSINAIWYSAVLVIILSIFRSSFDINLYIDAAVYGLCAVMIAVMGKDKSIFKISLITIVAFSVYFALTIWFQVIFPSAYKVVIQLFSEKNQEIILQLQNQGIAYTGFTTNPGFTSAHLTAGILVLFSGLFSTLKTKKYFIISIGLLAFLFVSFLMTGKRMPLLAICLTLLVLVFIPLSKKQKKICLISVLSILTVILITGILFEDTIRTIPVIDRIYQTINNLIGGKDITSSRTEYYQRAWSIFLDNPIFGIGWGGYRAYVSELNLVGKEYDVHNIYLQLLCEMGIIGFIFIVGALISFLVFTARALSRSLKTAKEWISPLLFSFGYQFYIAFYGITGNPLYDTNYVLLYFFSICIMVSCCKYLKESA